MIPLTQYLLPDGRKTQTGIQLDQETEDLAKKIIADGYRFEIEMLRTGEISMEIVKDVPDPDCEDSIAMDICGNGPQVPIAVKGIVYDAATGLKLV